MSSSFFSDLKRMRDIVRASGSVEQKWHQIEPLLADPAIKREFWKLPEESDWISLLRVKGEFENPPDPITDGESLRFPRWDASKFLVRMSAIAPSEVAEIFENVRSVNPSVNGDLIDAANKLPIEHAARLCDAVGFAAEHHAVWVHFKDACSYCERLIAACQIDSALRVAKSLFEPPKENAERTIRGPMDYWYREGLSSVVLKLVDRRPKITIESVSRWLVRWVEIDREGRIGEDGDDFSYIWRPAIEEHEQNSDYDLPAFVVSVLRQCCERAVERNELEVVDVLKLLRKFKLLVFTRIRIHLVNEYFERVPALAIETILDESYFDDSRLKHEYSRNVERRFGLLDSDQQQRWLRFLERGPKYTDDDDQQGSVLQAENRRQYWRFHRLHWIRDYIDGILKEEYVSSLEKFEDTNLANFVSYSGGVRYGYESPMSIDDLEGKDFSDVLAAVSSWMPDSDHSFGPSVRGLADTFEQFLSAAVEAYSQHAIELIGKPPAFVGAFLSAMRKAVVENKTLLFEPSLKLCEWVIDTGIADDEETRVAYAQQRDSAIDFIRILLEADRDAPDRLTTLVDLRELIWKCIRSQSDVTAVSWVVSDNELCDPRDHSFTTQAINSSRGKAIESAFSYAAWVTRAKPESLETTFSQLDLLDFRDLLENQFAENNRNWLSHAIVGSRLSSLYSMDRRWLETWGAKIFSLEEIDNDPKSAFGWAAWNAFLVWTNPHKAFLGLLREQYFQACERMTGVEREERQSDSPVRAFSKHVAIYYGRGHDSFEHEPSLIDLFFKRSPAWLRREMMQFVGRSFRKERDLPPEVVLRFKSLWEHYWKKYGPADLSDHPTDDIFSEWFAFGKFDERWLVLQLLELLSIFPGFRPGRDLVNRLAELAPNNLQEAVKILRHFIEADDEYWRIAEWDDAAKAILGLAVREGDADSRETAKSLIDRLGRSGLISYGDLLISG